MSSFVESGNIIDVVNKQIFAGHVTVKDGTITSVIKDNTVTSQQYILPGFIDAHVHIESSMLIPSEFARLASVHGTVATVSDPHEIGNVLGIDGVRYMIDNSKKTPFHIYFGAPSCVPATSFETAGATIGSDEIRKLFVEDNLKYLSEMMNYPGVLARDALVMDKIKVAHELGLPVDGHAPGLKGDDAAKYISAGISTDHECFTLEEALDKLKYGMKILIREGSAAKNYDALQSLIRTHPDHIMFCSDDKHPHELVAGHINQLVRRAIVDQGHELMNVLRCACYNPLKHYGLDIGLLQPGDPADFITIDNLRDFHIKKTWVKGQCLAEGGKSLLPSQRAPIVNYFQATFKTVKDFEIIPKSDYIQVIEAKDGQLVTQKIVAKAKIDNGNVVSNPEDDVLKLAIVNRYGNAPVAIGFIHNMGLKRGAIASCIAHDSHNIIATGVTDKDICDAINAIIAEKGGISVADNGNTVVLPLPVAGIMSHLDGYEVAKKYAELDRLSKDLGSKLSAPFMTLSFMALLVIPSLKLSDKGLFDGEVFAFTNLFI